MVCTLPDTTSITSNVLRNPAGNGEMLEVSVSKQEMSKYNKLLSCWIKCSTNHLKNGLQHIKNENLLTIYFFQSDHKNS